MNKSYWFYFQCDKYQIVRRKIHTDEQGVYIIYKGEKYGVPRLKCLSKEECFRKTREALRNKKALHVAQAKSYMKQAREVQSELTSLEARYDR